MSSRALSHEGGWAKSSIWKGEKFDDFIKSNSDVYIIMIGNNDNVEKLNGTFISLWNKRENVTNFVETYQELVGLLRE